MGGSSKSGTPSPGFRYLFGLHIGISRGPVDEQVEIEIGGRKAWKGSVTESTSIQIDAANLFGGDKGEGGVAGVLDIMMGDADQPRNQKLSDMLSGAVSACRGVYTQFFDGQIAALNPYPKPWKQRVRRALKGWDADNAWYPEKAKIVYNGSDPDNTKQIHAMNGAHILFECLTNRDWGRGLLWGRLDLPAWQAAADTLHAEGFGLCLRWTRQTSLDDFMQTVADHINAVMYSDRATGLRTIKLVRDDYDPETLPVFTFDTGLLKIEEDDSSSGETMVNEIIVEYVDPVTDEVRPVRWQNLAAIQSYGVKSETRSYQGLPTASLAARVAARDGIAASSGVRRFKLHFDRRARGLKPMAPFRISAPEIGIENIVLRAGLIQDTPVTDGEIVITAIQDVFGLPATAYVDDQPSLWTPPSYTPVAVVERRLDEVPWRTLARRVSPGELAEIDATACYLYALAKKPSSLAIGADLASRVGSAAYTPVLTGGFCPNAQIVDAIGPTATTAVLANHQALSEVQQGSAFLLGNEWCRLDDLTLNVGTMTVTMTFARGCIDTVPAAHAAGSRVWFAQDSEIADPTEYAPSVTVDVKLLTRTSTGVLDASLAPSDSLTLLQRQHRPYPPGLLRINGAAYPAALFGSLSTTWAHRDRLLQADQMVDAEATSVGPEAGTTYTRRVYLDNVLVNTEGEITGTSDTPGGPTADGLVRIEVEAVRDGLTSWQAATAQFDWLRTEPRITEDGEDRITEDGQRRIVE